MKKSHIAMWVFCMLVVPLVMAARSLVLTDPIIVYTQYPASINLDGAGGPLNINPGGSTRLSIGTGGVFFHAPANSETAHFQSLVIAERGVRLGASTGPAIMDGDADPNVGVGADVPVGSLYIQSTDGSWWRKTGSLATDWVRIAPQ